MMPEAAIACACRSAIAVSCGSVLTVDSPCACRYREIISTMSSACASVDVIATTAPSKTAFIAYFPRPLREQDSLAPDEADIGHRCLLGPSWTQVGHATNVEWRKPAASLDQTLFRGIPL